MQALNRNEAQPGHNNAMMASCVGRCTLMTDDEQYATNFTEHQDYEDQASIRSRDTQTLIVQKRPSTLQTKESLHEESKDTVILRFKSELLSKHPQLT